MSTGATLEETLRAIVREVVREEVRSALAEHSMRNVSRPAVEHEGYLSISGAAALADVAPGTLRRWIRTGRLPVRRAGRVYRIARRELEDFLARGGRSADVVEKAREFVARSA